MGDLPTTPQITLSVASSSAVITYLQDYSRVPLPGQHHTVTHTLNNNAVVSGALGEPKLAWTLDFWVTSETARRLQDVILASKLATAPQVTLVDYVSEIVDVSTPTRATAPSPFDTVTPLASGNVYYFANFRGFIVESSLYESIVGFDCAGNRIWAGSLVFHEGDKSA